jgi:transcriptional regulator with GAF, ATPase, and Fis domain
MPAFAIAQPGQPLRLLSIHKRVLTLGSKADCDIRVSGVAELEANLVQTPHGWSLSPFAAKPVLEVDGKRVKKETPLGDGAVIRAGDMSIVFSAAETPGAPVPAATAAPKTGDAVFEALRALTAELEKNFTLDNLLERLLDGLIGLTGADRGFLLLQEGEGYQVKVARNVDQKTIADPQSLLSDSIVKRVLEGAQPLLVSDAAADERFRAAQSVMDLQLTSVLAVPLRIQGEVLGVIYLGNHRIRDHFTEQKLAWASVFAAQAALLLTNLLSIRDLSRELQGVRLGEILGSCDGITQVFRRVEKVAPVDVPVLVTGETGTGKELAAREIHRLSKRPGRFVSINCGAIPETLIESELFGHVKGSFTGAIKDRIGCFQAAHGGTLFLDEIGELAVHLQVKLLRVLQEKIVTKVGSDAPEEVDVRIVAATNRDLKAEAAAGRFREDLLYRLNVIQLTLPPLRERGDDILLLAKYFLGRYRTELRSTATGFGREALLAMREHRWPGNIRELENRVKRALVLTEQVLLTPGDLELKEPDERILTLQEAKDRYQGEYIDRVLALNGGNRNKTAEDLGVDPRTIYRHLAKKRGVNESDLMSEEGAGESA